MQDQDRHRRMLDDVFGDAAEYPARDPGASMAAHHEQVGLVFLYRIQNVERHCAAERPGFDLESCQFGAERYLGKIGLRLFRFRFYHAQRNVRGRHVSGPKENHCSLEHTRHLCCHRKHCFSKRRAI